MRDYLVIPDVDFDMLEAQILVVNDMTDGSRFGMSLDEKIVLDGIMGMLNQWSYDRLVRGLEEFVATFIKQHNEWPKAFLWLGESYDRETYEIWMSPNMREHWDNYIKDSLSVNERDD